MNTNKMEKREYNTHEKRRWTQ